MPDNNNLNILVVDDEALIQDMLRLSLESIPCRVTTVNNGLEALYAMLKDDFDMVLMDVRMPVMDGIKATKFLRKCELGDHSAFSDHKKLAITLQNKVKGSRTPIIALTGNIGDREIVLQAGMDEYIPKPFMLSTIYDMLDQFCKKSDTAKSSDKRRHTRHQLKDDAIIVSENNIGQVVDISHGGLAIKYINPGSIPNEWSATFFNQAANTTIADLPLKLAHKGEASFSSTSGVITQTVGAMFNHPGASKQDQINQLICSLYKQKSLEENTASEAPQLFF